MNKETAKMTQALVNAGEKGNAAEVRRLLKAGAHIRNGDGALSMACRAGSVACVRLLLNAGANANTCGNWYTPLMWACMKGHTDVARVLLEVGGADANAVTCEDETALYFAAQNNLPELANLLLEHGADINAEAVCGTPFAQAAYHGHVRMAMHLLSRGANPLIGRGLQYACEGGSLKLVKRVIAAGARPEDESYCDAYFDNPMMCATVWTRRFNPAIAQLLYDRGWRFEGIEGDHPDEVGCKPRAKQWLLEHGAFDAQPEPVAKRQTPESTPAQQFDYLLYSSDFHGAEAMLERINPAERAVGDFSPLVSACCYGRLDLAKRLVEMGADIHAAAGSGFTALMRAARSGNTELVRWLLGLGADVNAVDKDGETALMHGSDANVAALLLDRGARADMVSAYGDTALHRYADMRTVRRLVALGCPLDSVGRYGRQALIDAAEKGNCRLVDFLLESGANANVAFRVSRCTALHAACSGIGSVRRGRFYPVIQALLKAGANPNAEDDGGLTPLMTLCGNSHATVKHVRLLLEHGANPAPETPEGWTAEDFAQEAGLRNIVKLLRNSAARTTPKP